MSVAYGEQQRQGSALGASGAQPQRELERQYHVVLQDSLGHPALGFRDGTWFRLTALGAQALQLRGAIRTCPHAAGSIVQIACWWMRENPLQPRSLDLATELALTVGELVRVCPADGLGTTSMDLLPMAMAAVAQSAPPATSAPALPAGTSTPSYPTNGFGSQDPLGTSGYSTAGSYGATSGYGSTSGSTSGYGSSNGASSGYATSNGYGTTEAATAGYDSGSTAGYGSTTGYDSATGYDSLNGSTSGYATANGSTSGYGSANGSTGTYSTGAYATTDPQSSYSATPAYSSTSYDAAQTSYLPATQAAPATALANGWFEPADGTGTGGFPKVPPAPVLGRPSAPAASAPPAAKPYPPSPQSVPPSARGYSAQPQAALPAAPTAPSGSTASSAPGRGYGEAADWDPRPAAPRRPSHQPRPQQAAPRSAPAPAANGQAPRPRPQQPPDDRRAEQDLSRSSDRNTVPPRRPAAGQQQRGTMGRRPASRPGRPSDW